MKQPEILTVGAEHPQRTSPRRLALTGLVLLLTGAVLCAGLLVAKREDEPQAASPPGRTPAPSPYTGPQAGANLAPGPDPSFAAAETPGLLISGASQEGGSTLDRRDRTAAKGPWTVLVRRPDGSLGHHGAVVTFPVPAPLGGRTVEIGRHPALAADGQLTWFIDGAFARIRGDLTEHDLIAIAAATRIADGRPQVKAPPGLTMAAVAPSRPTYLREARYSSTEVGESAALGGGLTYTGVLRSGAVEDTLYSAGFQPAGTVHGKPAIVTSALGGNAILAWEPKPGMVAYVGYSGELLDGDAVAALHRLAQRTRLLNEHQWQATNPVTVDQVNTVG